MRNIRRTAVIGAGVMGSAIAAHLANAGLEVLLLDLVPEDLIDEERQQGLTLQSPAVRNRRSRRGLERALAARPGAFFNPEVASRVKPGNVDDDLPGLSECDWVVEAVVEHPKVKLELFARLAPYLAAEAILSSNTSGLSVTALAEKLPENLRPRFLGTHFFNPPRYLRLLELIPTPFTSPQLIAELGAFGRRRLGKGIVVGKDTPNFVANRIGVYAMFNALHHMQELNLSFAEVDAIAGPAIGRPKSGVFRTADMVGLDTLLQVAQHTYQMLSDDEEREIYRVPAFLEQMVQQGLLGDKTGGGFYRRDQNGERLVFDPAAGDYRPFQKPQFSSLAAVKKITDSGKRLAALLAEKDTAAQFVWRHLRDTLLYAVRRIPEISDRIEDVDSAMCWGFNWELGPFAMLDAIGVETFISRAEQDGVAVPKSLRLVPAFYKVEAGAEYVWDLVCGQYRRRDREDGDVCLTLIRSSGGVMEKVADGSLLDLGDGVLCLEFHGKKNTIGPELLDLTRRAVARAEAEGVALVVGNQGALFSAGANLSKLGGAMAFKQFGAIDDMLQKFQGATMALKYARVPVVAAPFQLTLGGACEYVLHATAATAHAETYMGLVEVGVGLLPAGGGTKEMAVRALALADRYQVDPAPFLFKAFENIGMAAVSKSADELFALGYLRPGDRVTMNRDYLLGDAKRQALVLAATFRPQLAATMRAPGRSVAATMKSRLWNLQMGGLISEYDAFIGGLVADVLCGGDVPAGTEITEDYLLELEREGFLRLCGETRTHQRIEHMLKTGKPLRN